MRERRLHGQAAPLDRLGRIRGAGEAGDAAHGSARPTVRPGRGPVTIAVRRNGAAPRLFPPLSAGARLAEGPHPRNQAEIVPKLFHTPGVPPVTQIQPTVPPADGALFQITSPRAQSPLLGAEVLTPW